MKINTFFIGTLALALSFTACQNNASKSEADHSSMDMSDSSDMNMDNTASSGMTGVMDKMMKDMHQMEMTGNVDADFAMMMKSHHQGAIDMAELELNSGTDEKLKAMAQKIVNDQKAEIEELENFLNNHKNAAKNYDPMNKNDGFGRVMDKNMMMMMDMPKPTNESVDRQFVNMMIPHHQSAVDMNEGFIQYGKDPQLISMAKKMIAEQNKEIDQFQNWTE